VTFAFLAGANASAQPDPDDSAPPEPSQETAQESSGVSLRGVAELGFLAPLSHIIQFSRDGTRFDYVDEGGQDVLFPFGRLSLELGIGPSHGLIFLYQPLALRTQERLTRDLVVDDLTFPADTPVELFYGFPFWRASYLYDFFEGPDRELSIGGSLQIRDATITFASLDGTLFRTNRNVGPVPLLKARWRHPLGETLWLGSEVDGIYAPISVINGSDNEVTGALLDASIRLGLHLPQNVDGFLNLRYLGGGAVGDSDNEPPGDGYTKNWLQFFTVSLGVEYTLLD
jgi:hypothetical protein